MRKMLQLPRFGIPYITSAEDQCRYALELIVYDQLDSQSRPKGYQYFTICGAESGEKCSAISLLPMEAQRLIDSPEFNHFALAGICISDDRMDAASFITFLKKS